MRNRILIIFMLITIIITCSSCKEDTRNGGSEMNEKFEMENGTAENPPSAEKEGEIKSFVDTSTGTLTISGQGTVENFYSSLDEKNETIEKLIIGEGIYEIRNSFNGLEGLKEIQFPSTLNNIIGSFNEMKSLKKLDIPKEIYYLEKSFNDCRSLKELQFEQQVYLVMSFENCAIEHIYLPKYTVCEGSFAYCNDIKEIVIEPGVEVRNLSTVVNDSSWELGEGDADDYLHSPSFYCPDIEEIPKLYIFQPEWRNINLGLDEYFWVNVPEGENWEDYRNAPAEKIGG